jgi:UrcA family protein
MFKVIARYAPAVAAFGVLSSFGVSAQATERGAETPAVTVSYGDLNLNTSAGVEALYARLRAAARTACDVRGGRPLAEQVLARTCYHEALGAAVDGVQSLTLSALHREREHTHAS